MKKAKQQEQERRQLANKQQEPGFLKKQSIKELIAPSGIDASKMDHLEIISTVKRYARSFFIATLPRMCTFPELFRDLYFFRRHQHLHLHSTHCRIKITKRTKQSNK